MGVQGPFSLEGDSGAFVFDRTLNLVGMLFSRDPSKLTSYMTAFHDLFAGIKERTGAMDFWIALS